VPNLTAVAWQVVPRLPRWVTAAAFTLAANGAWLMRSKNTKRLERNLARVVPEAGRRQLRRLTRQGMLRNLKYYREALTMGALSGEQIDQLVHLEDRTEFLAKLGPRRQAILVLGHMGNWDAAAAWACRNMAPVITAAEHVKPEKVFQDFMAMRAKIGMRIIPIEKGDPTYPKLLRAAQSDKPYLVCLLADRDLSRRGVAVDWFGCQAMVGAGPAALAIDTGRPLYPVSMHTVGKTYTLHFHDEITIPTQGTRQERIRQVTQQWATVLEQGIKQSPADWHMFQKVFVEDLRRPRPTDPLTTVEGQSAPCTAQPPPGDQAGDQA